MVGVGDGKELYKSVGQVLKAHAIRSNLMEGAEDICIAVGALVKCQAPILRAK